MKYHLIFLSWSLACLCLYPSILYHKKYFPQIPFPSNVLMGLASGRHWQKIGARRGKCRVFLPFSVCYRWCSWQQLCLIHEPRSCWAAPPNMELPLLLGLHRGSRSCLMAWLHGSDSRSSLCPSILDIAQASCWCYFLPCLLAVPFSALALPSPLELALDSFGLKPL